MKKTTRFLALALSVLMLLGALAGCAASTTEPENTPAQDSAKTEQTAQTETTDNTAEPAEAPVEVSIAIWGAEDALANPDDPILKQLEEKTGVRLVPQNVTWDDSEQKIQLWATNGQLPDIFAGDFVSKSFYGNWIDQGVIRALPDDLSAYPNLAEHMQMERAQGGKPKRKALYDSAHNLR